MRAAVVGAPQNIVIREVAEPVPNGRALVKVGRAGLCATDSKIVDGMIPAALPVVLGHEIVGTVSEPGAAKLLPNGTRVLVDPGIACGHCVLCRADHGHLCRNGALLGRDVDGGFAQFVAVDERQLHPLPDGVGDDEAAVLQVLGTCVHAQTLVDVFPGQTAVVVGLGVSGLLHVQLLLARGVTSVIGVSRSAGKLELARKLGAAAVATPDEALKVVAEHTGGRGADLVVDSVGGVPTFRHAVEVAGIAATVLLFGITTERTGELPYYDLYFKELNVRSSRAARPRDYARGVELAATGAVRLAPLVTSSYPLDDIVAALAACTRDRSQLKVTLDLT